ncbi:MAG: sulfurtransferase, partial [Candidatus Thiodiazotropha sp.]
SAMMLWDKGYDQVYVVTDGFEGGTLKEGERKGWRLRNGWKNSDLPWSYKLNREKMYFPAEGS